MSNRVRSSLVAIALAAGGVTSFAGCTPEIGDKCILSTDCSTRGDRLCDTAQPGGYCTQFNCSKNSCPDEAACVLFNASVPGCGYDDRTGGYGSRVARSFCIGTCSADDDCRPGYVCRDPRTAPWAGLIQDDDQNKLTCLVAAEGSVDGGADAAIASFAPPCEKDADCASGACDRGRRLCVAPVCRAIAPKVPAIEAGAASVTAVSDGAVTAPVVDSGVADAGDAGDAADAD